MPLTAQEQRELDELEFEKLNGEKATPKPERRQLATSQLDKDRELLRSDAGRLVLADRAARGDLHARGNLGLLADIGMEGGGATAGQAIGALAGPWGIPVGGAIGGAVGNIGAQKRRVLAGEQEGFKAGQLAGATLAGAIPGASLESVGARSIAREAVKQGAGGIAAKTLETVVDEGRLPSAGEAAVTTLLPAVAGAGAQRLQAANPEIAAAVARANAGPGATKRATLEAGKEAGLFVVPSDVNPSWLNKRLESVAGPADIRRGVALRNQETTNAIAAADLGLPEGTEITRPVLRDIRAESAVPYRELASLSPAVGADVEALREARQAAHLNFEDYRKNATVASLRTAQREQALAEGLETSLEGAAVAAGRPELVDAMRAARTRIAKSYDYERALNVGDSGISAPVLGRAIDRGRPLSGGAQTIANFAEAFPRSVPEGAMVHPVGLSKTEMITGGLLGGGGVLATGDPRYAAAILAPVVASTAARKLVLSSPYQSLVGNLLPPRVNATPPLRATTGRVLAQEAAQEIAEEVKPSEETAAPQKVADLPTLTLEEARKAPTGTRFIGTTGLAYEKLPDGKVIQIN